MGVPSTFSDALLAAPMAPDESTNRLAKLRWLGARSVHGLPQSLPRRTGKAGVKKGCKHGEQLVKLHE